MTRSKLAKILGASLLLAPTLAYAQNVESLIRLAIRLVDMVTPVLFTLALAFFVWAGIGLIRADEDSRADRKNQLLWGVVAMFVIFSIWGITRFIGNTLSVNQQTTIPRPQGFTQ